MEKRVLMDVKFGPSVDYATHSPANKEWAEYNKKARYALGYIVDKYGKNHAWNTITGVWDYEKKGIHFTLLVDQNGTKEVDVTYEDLCKEFGWKSFKINDEHSTVFPVLKTWEEKEAEIAPLIAKTKRHDAKVLKEMEKNGVKVETAPVEVAESAEEPAFEIDGL